MFGGDRINLKNPHETTLKYKLNLLRIPALWKNVNHTLFEEAQLIFMASCCQLRNLMTRVERVEWARYAQRPLPKMICDFLLVHIGESKDNLLRSMLINHDRLMAACRIECLSTPTSRPSPSPYRELWFQDVFPSDIKLCLYLESPTFWSLIEFVARFFIRAYLTLLGRDFTLEATAVRVQFYARAFHFYMNEVFQFSPGIATHYVVDFLQPADPRLSPQAWAMLHKNISANAQYPRNCKDYLAMNGIPKEYVWHDTWKNKNAVIPSILSDISARSKSPLRAFEILAEVDQDLENRIKYINIRDWTAKVVRDADRSHRFMSYVNCLVLLSDCNIWMKYKANVPNWADKNTVLHTATPWAGQLSLQPKIADLSRGEWCLIHQRRMYIGDLKQVVEKYRSIIIDDEDGYIYSDAAESQKTTVCTFMNGIETAKWKRAQADEASKRRRVRTLRQNPQADDGIGELGRLLINVQSQMTENEDAMDCGEDGE